MGNLIAIFISYIGGPPVDEFETSIEDMPNEIIVRIFSFLDLADRKNARLVCKLWHRLSYTCSLITHDVAFIQDYQLFSKGVFSSYFRHVNVEIVLKYSDCDCLSNDSAMKFWSKKGTFVKSLCVRSFGDHYGFISQFFELCPKVEYLCIKINKTADAKTEHNSTTRIYLPELTKLKLSGDSGSINKFLNALVVPKLKNINLCGDMKENNTNALLRLINRPKTKLKEISFKSITFDDDFMDILTDVLGSQLERLHIQNCGKIDDWKMQNLARRCLKLKQLTLGGCQCTNILFTRIFSRLKHLTVIALVGSRFLTDEEIFPLKSLTLLSHLELSFCSKITDVGISYILGSRVRKQLVELRLVGLFKLTDDVIMEIAPNIPNLKILNISYCFSLTQASLRAVTKYNLALQCLSMRECKQINKMHNTTSLNSLQNLVHLDSRNSSLETCELWYFKLRNLEALEWEFSEIVSDGLLVELKKNCPKLKYINYFSYRAQANNMLKLQERRHTCSLKCFASPFGPCFKKIQRGSQ